MKGDCHSFHMRYSSMICCKRLQSDRPSKLLNYFPLVYGKARCRGTIRLHSKIWFSSEFPRNTAFQCRSVINVGWDRHVKSLTSLVPFGHQRVELSHALALKMIKIEMFICITPSLCVKKDTCPFIPSYKLRNSTLSTLIPPLSHTHSGRVGHSVVV